jgi:ribosomal protein S18 acetylase RimI-like enzyme
MSEEVRQGRVGVRDAATEDAEFLLDMLLEAVNWAGEEKLSRKQLLRDRTLVQYVAGWQREGDIGVVAVDLDGPGGLQIPVGAAWLRRFSRTAPGHGYVADDVPELSIGVVEGQRRRGIGRGLLRALLTRAREAGLRAVSASVATGNPAAGLYESTGFVVVSTEGDASTLVLDLAAWQPAD